MITTQATTIVRLIYENGVFRPLEPIELAEGQIVQLSLAAAGPGLAST